MANKKKIGCLSVGIFFLVLILHTCTGGLLSPLPYRHLAPFLGEVIDTDTKEPIAGAVVLAVYYTNIPSIAGGNTFVTDGQETLTDENGEFRIPRVKRWFAVSRGYPRGTLIIFKPGYGTLEHKRSKAVDVNKSWPPPRKHIVYELPKLETIEEREENAIYVDTFDKIPYQRRKLYMKTINEERISLGLRPRTIPNGEGQE